jgi:hypothetical protein
MKKSEHISYDPDIVIPFLESEWEYIIERLDESVSKRLKCPHFRINYDMKDWGVWHGGGADVLELRADLLEHPWTSVLEVLKHEMAHQVTELLYGSRVMSHGPEFKRVCQQLGANPLASGSCAPADIDIFAEQSDENTETGRLYARIRKLLALANSTDPHEAELALAKAHQLMAKHGIDQEETKEGFGDFSIFTPYLPPSWSGPVRITLGNIVRCYFHVNIIIIDEPDLRTGRTRKVLALCGNKGNLRVAGYVWDCLVRFLQTSWPLAKERLRASGCQVSSGFFKSFALGVLEKIDATLAAQVASAPETYAIAPAVDKRLQEYFQWMFPDVAKSRSRQKTIVYTKLLEMGREVGGEFRLNLGVEEGQKPKRRLLE